MLIPNSKQWKKWSLPSKLTAIGTLAGLISLFYTLTVDLFGKVSSDAVNAYDYYISDHEILNRRQFDLDAHRFRSDFSEASKNLEKYIEQGELANRLNLSKLINKSITKGVTVFIRLKMSHHTFDIIKRDGGYRLSLPKLGLTKEDAYFGSFFGYGPEKMDVFLDDEKKSKSGFDETLLCKSSSNYHISGFYKFSTLGQSNGFKSVYGRLVTVDQAMATRNLEIAAKNDECYKL